MGAPDLEPGRIYSTNDPDDTVGVASKPAKTGEQGGVMSVYKVIELVGVSPGSWEEAAKSAIEIAAGSVRDLRIAEVADLDMQIDDGKVVAYRARVKVSFKHEASA